MSLLTERLMANARIIPISEPNRVRQVTKQADGGLRVEFNSGAVTDLAPGDALIQAFVVYTMLADL